ncbi:MAG: cytidine deaminase [Clostridia bacterium]|nr:cytidine deaminase [Clostridia bacterium]
MTDKELYDIAKNAMEYSYSPYSNFRVGAALLCENGKVYTGTNVENASFGATVCAERVALVKAVSEGCKTFTKIAISADKNPCSPCGICRQSLIEFSPEMQVVYMSQDGCLVNVNLKDLLLNNFVL